MIKRSGHARADEAAPVEYLYVPCARTGHGRSAQPRRWVQAVPVVRKTAKWIYYTSDTWDRAEAVVSPGCISRQEFETDTRYRADRRGYPAGVIPVPGARPGSAGRLFFATRQAAEHHLYRGDGEQAGPAARDAAPNRGSPNRDSPNRDNTDQGAAPGDGRRSPRPRRHRRAVHPGAPPVRDGAWLRATVTSGRDGAGGSR